MDPESPVVLRGPFVRLLHCFQYKGLTGTLSLIWTLSLYVTSWQNRAPGVLPEVYLESLEVIKIGSRCPVTLDTLMSLSTLCQEFLSFCGVQGHQWPTEVQRPSESWETLKRGSGDTATPGLHVLICEPGGDIPPAKVYLVQNAQILSKVARCGQVNP